MLTICTLVVVFYPLHVRTRGTSDLSGADTIVPYYLAGVGGLNCSDETLLRDSVYFDAHQLSAQATPGANTLQDLFILLERLGLPVNGASRGYFESVCFYNVLGSAHPSAVFTTFLDFWLDFGLVGVAVIVFGVAFIGTLAQRLVWEGRIAAVPAFSFMMGQIFWSFSADYMLNSLRYTLLLVVSTFVMRRFIRSSPPEVLERSVTAPRVRSKAMR